MMPRQFLEFDLSEDTDGLCSWSALACPSAAHAPALQREVQDLLADLTRRLGSPGPLDEGHAWDMALDSGQEGDRPRVSLDLCGGPALAEALSFWTPA